MCWLEEGLVCAFVLLLLLLLCLLLSFLPLNSPRQILNPESSTFRTHSSSVKTLGGN